MAETIPATMRCLVLKQVDDPLAPPSARLELVERPVPQAGPGQVLIRMEAATANPSDLYYLEGTYGVAPAYGRAAGFEGVGRVVASGGGLLGHWLKGKRVACASADGDGTWAEYMLCSVKTCLPVAESIPAPQACTLIVNPFTAWALLDRAEALGSRAVIQNAAASQVGKLVIRLAKRRGMQVISTVRREEQREALQAIGADHVLVTKDPDFDEQLRRLAAQLKARVFLDAVGGSDTARVLSAMPNKSTAIVYGRLSADLDDPYGGRFPVEGLIFQGKALEGFWLSTALPKLGVMGIMKRSKELQKLFAQGALSTDVAATHDLADYPAGLDAYAKAMSAGKHILAFG